MSNVDLSFPFSDAAPAKSNRHRWRSAQAAIAVLALGCAGESFATSVATTPIYSGGATLDEKVLRNIFNIYGSTGGGDLAVGVDTPPASAYRSSVEILYLGVGSGNGIKAYDADSPALLLAGNKTPDNPPVASTRDFGPFFGTGTGASWTPSSKATNYFPKLHFVSADQLASADISAATSLGYGPPIQVPALALSVAIAFTPTPGWNPKGGAPSGSSSRVQFSTNTLCGVFNGDITNWSNAAITADNGKKQLGSGTITIVYRHDSGATTFHLANALLAQCGTQSNPTSSHPIPDQWLTDNKIPNSAPYVTNNSFFVNVFNAGHLPANYYNNLAASGVSGGASTNLGVQEAVDATSGAIGYLSTDFVKPYQTVADPNGNPAPASINLQTYYTYTNKLTPKYLAPTSATTLAIVSTLTPPSFSGSPAPAYSAANWGVLNPAPLGTGAYPVGGFTYFDLYSCYAAAGDINALFSQTKGSLGLFRWYFGSSTENGGKPQSVLTSKGFAFPPSPWLSAAHSLLFAYPASAPGTPGQAKTACTSVTKGA